MNAKANNDKKVGRTFYDFLVEFKIYVIGLIALILILILVLFFNGSHIEIWGFKINPPKHNPIDTSKQHDSLSQSRIINPNNDSLKYRNTIVPWIMLNYNSCQTFDVIHSNEIGESRWWQDKNGQLHTKSDKQNVSKCFIYQAKRFKKSVSNVILVYGPGDVYLSAADGGLGSHINFYIWDSEPIHGQWETPTNFIWEKGIKREGQVNSYSWASGSVNIKLPRPTEILYFGLSIYDPWKDVSVNVNIDYLKIKCL